MYKIYEEWFLEWFLHIQAECYSSHDLSRQAWDIWLRCLSPVFKLY